MLKNSSNVNNLDISCYYHVINYILIRTITYLFDMKLSITTKITVDMSGFKGSKYFKTQIQNKQYVFSFTSKATGSYNFNNAGENK